MPTQPHETQGPALPPDITWRTLLPCERRNPTSHKATPLLIQATEPLPASRLQAILDSNSRDILAALAQHGALLLRGFDVNDVQQFEKTVLSIRGMTGMSGVFMSEPGRTLVKGTRYVLHTNTLYKTGGSFNSFSFHTENYYVPDVPRYISFYCQKPSMLGGETGLIDMAGVYAELPEPTKARLAAGACLVSRFTEADVRQRYGTSAEEFVRLFASLGMTVCQMGGAQTLAIYKPSVFEHPDTGLPALQLNLSGELNGRALGRHAMEAFWQDFQGLAWAFHRFCWQHPGVHWIRDFALQPLKTLKRLRTPIKPIRTEQSGRVGDLFDDEDIRMLAFSMRRHYSDFKWRRNDVLIVDNLRMSHSGMPGFGARELKAMICNRVEVPCHAGAPGQVAPSASGDTECIGQRLSSRNLPAGR